ncbi:hypothetical protein ANN_00966 [Periplaneta americana]|uniref:Uncharacterized protein n=1 Tax=Periplaneta americana TaxID=6978 RepID=A0ABQ8TSC8_PERAM|nr:hypothetical protein ANN_00966 [Periplaneta americana]
MAGLCEGGNELPGSLKASVDQFRIDSPSDNNSRRWYRHFEKTGCICKRKSSGYPRVSNARVENVGADFVRSPQKSLRQARRGLGMSRMTIWRVLRKRPYRLQLLQFLKPTDLVARTNFFMEMQHVLQNYDYQFIRFVFSDEFQNDFFSIKTQKGNKQTKRRKNTAEVFIRNSFTCEHKLSRNQPKSSEEDLGTEPCGNMSLIPRERHGERYSL